MKLSSAQRLVLEFLADRPWASPSEIGWAMTPNRTHPLVPQGAGRVGASMAVRMIKQGLVEHETKGRSGFPAYRISPAGRRALESE